MNSPISLNIKKAMPFACEEDILKLKALVASAHDTVHSRSGEGQEFLGWLNLPEDYDRDEFERIKIASDKIKKDSKILVVIGIGGSYLGARAVIESLTHSFNNNLSYEKRKAPAIYFAGNNISPTYLANLIDIVKDEDFSINVISKSGTTTEPAIAFRVFKEILENKYGKEEARKRIYVTTDKEKGALKKLADGEGYETFVIPDDIGGRFSVLTAVGLLPIAAAGINIEELILGAGDAMKEYSSEDISENNCYRYAALRHILYTTGKTTEIMVSYEPCLQYFNEWWKQLFGESHGKNKRGIFPTSVNFSTDLHSMGQYIQDGLRNIFETIINVKNPKIDMMLKEEKENIDGLNFLSGKTVDYVNKKAMEGTALAHNEGGVPNIVITMEELTAYNIGYLIYFFEKACAIGGYLLGINPFDQEGVEAYKKNMFALLGKPGYEHIKEELEKRLED